MARTPGFRVTNTSRGWKVEIPTRLSQSGKRERSYFPTRDAAKEFATKLKDQNRAHGENALAIPASLADEASRAAALLKPYGIGLLDAARRAVAEEERQRASVSIEAALEAFTKVKEGMSSYTLAANKAMAKALREDFSGRILSTLTAVELGEHIEKRTGGPVTFNHRIRVVSSFWRWCSRQPRGWCNPKEVDHLEKKEIRSVGIGLLTYAQSQALMKSAEDHDPACVPGFAIALFTGMRKAELERLTPKDVTTEGITVPASSSKTGRRRFIQIPTPLTAWLSAYPISETVLPSNWPRKEKAVRRLAGWRVWSDLVDPPEPQEELPEWPGNALRHTHASVMVALGKPLESLTFEFGHSGGAAVLKSHYVGVMSKAEAIKIWSIGPKGKKIPVIQEVA